MTEDLNLAAADAAYKKGRLDVTGRAFAELCDALPDIQLDITRNDENFEEYMRQILATLPPARVAIVRKRMNRFFHREQIRLQKERRTLIDEAKLDHMKAAIAALERLESWLSSPFVMAKPHESMVQDFCHAIDENRIFNVPSSSADIPKADRQLWLDMAQSASVYLVQHNWAAAFTNAKDYLGGEIKLPDDACAFEFRLSNRHVIAFATDSDGALFVQFAVQVKKGWAMFPVESNGINDPLSRLINDQIRAVAIALDAEVATTEIVRMPHRSNHGRKSSALPAYSYHLISLARRSRPEPLEQNNVDAPIRHLRLHFRRGHWRHFETHKTWIKWMLVGDPSLGFVDKEYRL